MPEKIEVIYCFPSGMSYLKLLWTPLKSMLESYLLHESSLHTSIEAMIVRSLKSGTLRQWSLEPMTYIGIVSQLAEFAGEIPSLPTQNSKLPTMLPGISDPDARQLPNWEHRSTCILCQICLLDEILNSACIVRSVWGFKGLCKTMLSYSILQRCFFSLKEKLTKSARVTNIMLSEQCRILL